MSLLTPSFSTDFSSPPPNTRLFGTGGNAGVIEDGVLKLTKGSSFVEGAFIIDDLDNGAPIRAFTATFKLLIGGGTVPDAFADGLSFNFASDLPNSTIPEEGAGTGLTVSFDTYDNGLGEAPAIDVKWNGTVLASTKNVLSLFRVNQFVPVRINVDSDGTLDLWVANTIVQANLPGAFSPTAGRFGFGARSGAAWDNHFIDDLTIVTVPNVPPTLTTVSPLSGANEDTAFPINYATLAAAADEADGNGDTLSFRVETVSSGTLTKNGTGVSPGATLLGSGESLVWTPPWHANGIVNAFTIRAWDGTVASANAVPVQVSVAAVNDAPSSVNGANQAVLEDAGPQIVVNWATSISAGPSNESGQTLSFQVSNDNNGLFSAQPVVSATGTLTYTPAANANGSAKVTVKLKDDGGTANRGQDTSWEQSFAITVQAVNDAPDFTLTRSTVSVAKNAGAQSIPVATGMSKGPGDESIQTLKFLVTVANKALFTVQPLISPTTGILTFTPKGTVGTTTVSVMLQDSGATANGGIDKSAAKTFGLTITETPGSLANRPSEVLIADRSRSDNQPSEPAMPALPELRRPVRTGGSFDVFVPTSIGRIYQLEYKDSLEESDWTPIMSLVGDGSERELVDPNTAPASRFYRVRVAEEPSSPEPNR